MCVRLCYDYVWTNWCDLVAGGCPDTWTYNHADTGHVVWEPEIQRLVASRAASLGLKL